MTLPTHIEELLPGDNVIIGLGDSFTQGVGAYSLKTWERIKAPATTYNISGQYFIEEQGKNNWVKQISTHFLPEYKSISLGVNGAGNRAAIKELYLNPLPKYLKNVVVILMATGIERFDFLKNEKITSGSHNHFKWRTIWPIINSSRPGIGKLEKEYAKNVWSSKVDVMEFILNVAEAQTFCKLNNYKFLFASAFSPDITEENFENILEEDKLPWIDLIDWGNNIRPEKHIDFMSYIIKMQSHPKVPDFYTGQQFVSSLPMPLKYITPCNHWTIEGSFEVAKKIHQILKDRNIV